MHVAELWRYPVKSLAGESLAVAELTPGGLAGDPLRSGRGAGKARARSASAGGEARSH
jgi:hypothetical protein